MCFKRTLISSSSCYYNRRVDGKLAQVQRQWRNMQGKRVELDWRENTGFAFQLRGQRFDACSSHFIKVSLRRKITRPAHYWPKVSTLQWMKESLLLSWTFITHCLQVSVRLHQAAAAASPGSISSIHTARLLLTHTHTCNSCFSVSLHLLDFSVARVL